MMNITFSYIPAIMAESADELEQKHSGKVDGVANVVGNLAGLFSTGLKKSVDSGYKTIKSRAKAEVGKLKALTVLNFLGYLPLVGVIVAVARVIFALACPPKTFNNSAYKQAQILRAFFECIPFAGIPLFFADGINTSRFIESKKDMEMVF